MKRVSLAAVSIALGLVFLYPVIIGGYVLLDSKGHIGPNAQGFIDPIFMHFEESLGYLGPVALGHQAFMEHCLEDELNVCVFRLKQKLRMQQQRLSDLRSREVNLIPCQWEIEPSKN